MTKWCFKHVAFFTTFYLELEKLRALPLAFPTFVKENAMQFRSIVTRGACRRQNVPQLIPRGNFANLSPAVIQS